MPCPQENQNCVRWRALSAEFIFVQEVGLTHARADSSTARAVATKQGASRKMKHFHTRFVFSQDLVFRKLQPSAKTDIGTKALGRERCNRLRSMLGMETDLKRDESSW